MGSRHAPRSSAVIQAASARMNSAKSVAAVGRAIVEEVGPIVDYHNARVYVIEGDDIVPIAFEGKVGAYEIVDWDVLRAKIGEGFTGWVAAHGIPLCIPDANDDPRGAQIEGTDNVPESMVIVPMQRDGAVIGVITLSKLGLNQFDDDDLQVLMILADQAATALESARLLTQTESMATELRQLLEMSQALTQTLDPKQVGALIARHLMPALGVDECSISAWDIAGDQIVSLGQYPDHDLVNQHPIYALADYPETRRVLETQAAVIIDAEDETADPAEVAILREEGYPDPRDVPAHRQGPVGGPGGARRRPTGDPSTRPGSRSPGPWPTRRRWPSRTPASTRPRGRSPTATR